MVHSYEYSYQASSWTGTRQINHWRTQNLNITPRLRQGITATLQQARQATHNSFQLAPKRKLLLPIDTAETSETSTYTAIGF